MSYFSLYMISILDNIQMSLIIFITLAGISVISLLIFISTQFIDNEKELKILKRILKWSIVLFLVSGILLTFIPSTDDVYKIIIFNKISNNKNIKYTSLEALKVTRDFLTKVDSELDKENK